MSFSEKIKAGYSTHIVINGDSIGGSTDAGEWSVLLKEKLHKAYNANVDLYNISKPGNSTFAGIVSWKMLDHSQQLFSDLVILCYGQNDPDDDNFKINYEALIRNTIKDNPNAEIIAILESSQREYTPKINAIIDLCEYYNIPYVDTIEAFHESGYSYEELTSDGIHPNSLGKEIYANAIYNVISEKLIKKQHLFDFKGERPSNKPAQNSDSQKYENCHYISIDKMTVKGNKIYVNIPKCSNIGIDIIYTKGTHKIALKINNTKYDIGYSWDYEFSQRHIDSILEGSFNAEKATIEVSSDLDLNNINGLICFE